MKEKDKYEKMKENLRNINEKLEEKTGNTRFNSANSRTSKNILLCAYKKICQISKEAYKNAKLKLLMIENIFEQIGEI